MNTKALRLHGEQVDRFARAVPNMGRLGELTHATMAMLRSANWRHYRDATGVYQFQPGEFDYFLALQAVDAHDVARFYVTPDERSELASAMDRSRTGQTRYRRSLDAVIAAHPHAADSLTASWSRHGWTEGKHPVGSRAITRAKIGLTFEKRAQERRRRTVRDRRAHLDHLVESIVRRTSNATEIRYVIDELRKRTGQRDGRPPGNHEQWARDLATFQGNEKALAKHWGITLISVKKRKSILNRRLSIPRAKVS
jgi:hypothetical protein